MRGKSGVLAGAGVTAEIGAGVRVASMLQSVAFGCIDVALCCIGVALCSRGVVGCNTSVALLGMAENRKCL